MKLAGFFVAALLVGQCMPAFAQYHYSHGDSRVVNQNQTGLYHPSATYIGNGTMSQSAQGKGAGVGGALPAVNMGSHVRTPGDNIYNNDGSDRMGNGALVYKDQEEAMSQAQRMKYRRMMARQMAQQRMYQQQQQGTYYVPGSNGAGASYSNAGGQMQFSRSGAATYGGGGTGYQAGTRSF